MPKLSETESALTDESNKWSSVRALAQAALDFHIGFLGCRMGAAHSTQLDANAKERILKIVRAVSWVESKHGTAGSNQPKRDPVQAGNPNDKWWKELTGQSGQGSRFIRGPNLSNLWANELAGMAEATAGFEGDAQMSKLGDKKKGHSDAKFSQAHSYYWGIVYLIHRINTSAGDKSFQCGSLSRSRLIDGAVSYNGGGDARYRQKIESALALIGDLTKRDWINPLEELPESHQIALSFAVQASVIKSENASLQTIRLETERDGSLKAVEVTFKG
ncbi:hypothetical protein [Ruegeria sp. HKCCD6428]|uniref:hypothetical protein n=1 Tax=Ruegeria sp. HKCCD6428 TaxID=2683002 RepID=UPI001491AE08|nr:hypothetical protein [Ruegeria sp. HKCCD6428]NOC83833.1 hypothetical protein [Ruegeria sp. HKCCD6428]